MDLRQRIENQVCVLNATGDLMLDEVEKFQNYLQPLVVDGEFSHLLLNLQQVQRIDSSGVGSLVCLFKALQKQSKGLRLCHCNKILTEIFQMLRLELIIPIESSEQVALSNLLGA